MTASRTCSTRWKRKRLCYQRIAVFRVVYSTDILPDRCARSVTFAEIGRLKLRMFPFGNILNGLR